MTKIMVDEAAPGMVLDESVKNANGSVLISADVALSEKHVRALKMWGIVSVSVKSEGGGDDESVDPMELEDAKRQIRPRFVLANLDNPAMDEIFKQVAIRHARST